MANCFGEDLYYSWSKEVFKAVKECYGEEMKLPKAHEKESSQEEEDNMDPTVRLFMKMNAFSSSSDRLCFMKHKRHLNASLG